MNDIKIVQYEVKRMMISKKYFYMLLAMGVWTYDILTRLVSEGMGVLAPFSKTNYASFLVLVNPMLICILILLGIGVFSKKEQAVRAIVFSASISQTKYSILKAAAIFIVTLFTALVPVLLSFIYYAYSFNYYNYSEFMMPIVLFTLPAVIFIWGLVMLLGKISQKLLYVLLLVTFFSGLFNIATSVYLDLCGNNLFVLYWAESMAGESGFDLILPPEFIYSRIVFMALGIVLLGTGCKMRFRSV